MYAKERICNICYNILTRALMKLESYISATKEIFFKPLFTNKTLKVTSFGGEGVWGFSA